MLSCTVACDRSDRLPARRPSARTKDYRPAAAVTGPAATRLGGRAGRQALMGREER
jgi:hypothetical protein